MKTHIVQYFYSDKENNEYGSGCKSFQKGNEIYYRAMLVFFETFKRFNDIKYYDLYFITNDSNCEYVPNFSFERYLEINNIFKVERVSI